MKDCKPALASRAAVLCNETLHLYVPSGECSRFWVSIYPVWTQRRITISLWTWFLRIRTTGAFKEENGSRAAKRTRMLQVNNVISFLSFGLVAIIIIIIIIIINK